jgi:fibronectin-binding autotransporter adhesin
MKYNSVPAFASVRFLHRCILTMMAILFCVTPSFQRAQASTLTWDPNDNSTDASGTWDTTSQVWFDGNQTDYNWNNAANTIAAFGYGTSGSFTVTLGVPIVANGLTFNAGSNYTIAGSGLNTLTLSGSSPTPVITANAASSTVSATLAGSTMVSVAGTGTLTLRGANTFAVAPPSTSGGAANVSLSIGSGSHILLGTATTLQNEVVSVTASGGLTFQTGSGGTFTIGGLQTGTGGIALVDNATPTPGAITLVLGNEGIVATLGLTSASAAGANPLATYGGILSGSGGLTKGGAYVATTGVSTNGVNNIGVNPFVYSTGATVAGTQQLSANNTYTGVTAVTAGTLQLSGAAGAISGTTGLAVSGSSIFLDGDTTAATNNGVNNRVNSAAGLILGGTAGGGTFQFSEAATAAGQSLASLTLNTGGSMITAINATGSDTGTLTLSGAGGSVYTDNTHGTVNFGSISGVAQTGSSIKFTNAPTGSSVSGTGANAILVGATLNGNDFISASSGALTAASYSAATASSTEAGLNVQAVANSTVVLGSGATPNSIAFNTAETSATALTLAGANVIGSGDIIVGATVTVAAPTIGGGTITSGSSTGDLQIFDYNLLGGNSGSGASSQNPRAGAGASGLTIGSIIANNGSTAVSVDVSGSAITYLSGVNTYTGGTYLDGGRLYINSDASLGSTTTEAGIFAENGYNSVTNTGILSTARNISVNAGATLLLSNGGPLLTDSGTLSGAGTLEIGNVSDATLVALTGSNSGFTGSYIVNGALRAQDGTGLSSNANIVLSGRSNFVSGLLEMSGSFTRSVGAGPGQIQWQKDSGYGGGGFAQNGLGTLTVNLGGSGAALTFGATGFVPDSISANSLNLQDVNSSNTLTFQNALVLTGNDTGGGVINNDTLIVNSLTNSNALTEAIVSGLLSGTGNLEKTGNGLLVLSNGSNSYTGPTSIDSAQASGGTLSVSTLANGGSNSGIGASSNAATNLVVSGATLQYTGGTTSTDRLFQIGTSTGLVGSGVPVYTAGLDASGTGALTFSNTGTITYGNSTANAAPTFTFTGTNTGNNTFAPALVDNGTGTLSVSKTGIGTWVLANTDSYTGGTTVGGGTLTIGNGTTGNISGGGSLLIANAAADAAVNINSGSLTDTISTLFVGGNGGTASGAAGALNLSTGTLTATAADGDATSGVFGENAGTYGALNVSGGVLSTSRLYVGYNGTGAVLISGGTVNVTGGTYGVIIDRGGAATASDVVTVSGGTLSTVAADGIYVGFAQVNPESGITVLNNTGGTISNPGSPITLYQYGTSVLNLDAGTTQAGYVTGGTGTNDLNFNGGILKGGTTGSSVFVSTAVGNAYVNGAFGSFNGGAVIDVNGLSETVAAALKAPTGNGITAIPLSAGGTGYIGTPVVVISGGGGSGATAIANINSNGVITGVTITNPGVGYTSAPTVTLVGGGGAGATIGAVTYGANTSGGLTLQGTAGTLTLSGVNTYTGTTTINAGTLVIGGAGQLSSTATAGTYAGNIVNNGTFQYNSSVADTLSGVLSGSTGVVIQSGAGALTLSNTGNTYGGGTQIGAGQLNIYGDGSLGAVPASAGTNIQFTAASGGVLQDTANNVSLNANRNITIADGATATLDSSTNTFTVAGAISALTGTSATTLTLAGSGAGSGILTGALSYAGTGGLILNQTSTGAWTYGGNGTTTLAKADIIVNAGTFNFGSTGTYTPSLTISADANGVNVGIFVKNSANFNMNAGTLSISDLQGLVLNATNTYAQTGGTLTTNGLIEFANGSSGAVSTVNISGGNLTTTSTSATDATDLSVRGTTTVNLSGTGTFTTPVLNMTTSQIGSGPASSTLNLGSGVSGGTLIVGSVISGTGGSTGTNIFNFNGGTLQSSASSTTFMTGLTKANVRNDGAIFNTAGFNDTIGQLLAHSSIGGDNATDGGLTKTGTGTLTLSAANTYTGATSINAGALSVGTVAASGTAQALGDGNVVNLGVAGTSSGLLVYTGGTGTLSGFTINALGNGSDTVQNTGSGILTLNDSIVKNGTTFTVKGGTINIAGVVSGSSANSDIDYNNVTSTVSVAGTYNGATHIFNTSTVTNGVNDALPDIAGGATANSSLILGDASETGTSLTNIYALGGFTQTLGGLTSTQGTHADTNEVIGNSATLSTLTLNIASGTDTYSGFLGSGTAGASNANNLALVKSGSGTLILSGANTNTGGTTVNGGTLQAGSSSALGATTAPLAVNGGGLFDLNGFNQTIGALTLGTGGSTIADSGAAMTLTTSGVTVNGTSNTFNSGVTVSGAVTQNSSSALTVNGTAGTDALATSATLAGTGTVSTVTLAGSDTLGSTGTLTTSGITASGTGNNISSGKVTGNITFNGASAAPAALNVAGIASGTVNVSTYATLSGTGTTGAVTLGGASSGINLVKSNSTTGSLTVGGLTTTGGGTLTFAIGTTSGAIDDINDTGTLVLGGSTSIVIANLNNAGSQSIVNGSGTTYLLLATTGISGSGSLNLSTTSLDGHNLSLSQSGNNYYLVVAAPVSSTSFTLTTSAGSTLLHAGASTNLTTTLTNTGSGSADSISYSNVGASTGLGSVSGSTISSPPTLANGNSSVSNTNQTFTTTAGTSGTATISSTGTLTNATIGGTPSGTPTGTSITVYSGQGTWSTAGSGTWGTAPTATPANWTVAGGIPGVTPGFTGVDTATFGTQAGISAITVSLAGATPNLNAINFTSSSTSYTLAQNSTGSITLSGPTPAINVTAGSHLISAPIALGSNTSLAVSANDQLTISGSISSSSSLSNTGAGTTVLSSSTGNPYSGGTTVSAGHFYVNSGVSGTSSGTGSGAVTVNGGTLAGSGAITTSSGMTVSSGGTLASGDAQSPTSMMVDGTHLAINNTSVSIASANLTFDLGAGTTAGAGRMTFGTPNINTTYLSLTGSTTMNFSGTDSISLVDLTNTTGSNGSLALRLGTPYLLIQAGANADYLNLVINSGTLASPIYSLSQNDSNLINGYVVGVYTSGAVNGTDVNPISINQYGADGVTPLTAGPNGVYPVPVLYLNAGQFEVVPEPGTWALMVGGLALLVVIQRRKNTRG